LQERQPSFSILLLLAPGKFFIKTFFFFFIRKTSTGSEKKKKKLNEKFAGRQQYCMIQSNFPKIKFYWEKSE
jgi:hypothetical protein